MNAFHRSTSELVAASLLWACSLTVKKREKKNGERFSAGGGGCALSLARWGFRH